MQYTKASSLPGGLVILYQHLTAGRSPCVSSFRLKGRLQPGRHSTLSPIVAANKADQRITLLGISLYARSTMILIWRQ